MVATDHTELVRRLVAGDPAALEDAYKQYAPRCNAVAYRILQDDTIAQDAVQEAFFSLWQHRQGLVVRSAGILPWLVVVTRNAALAMVRSGQARTSREERSHSNEQRIAPDPGSVAEAHADADRLRRALSQLPDELRSIIEMAYFRYHTMAQIAQATETPLGTVKRRAQSALRQLGQLLKETTS